ncbi:MULTISPECIES: trimeric intracellular cation channel family protein [unclassified Duganella]|uniref:trimeric intracellular cation channel family protein n=1 Tax=unclassified Duganella TaxID=2636909 RepID=UPI000E3418F5|nr:MULTISPECIES: trimeric intracellular cation channel family protein [unclassified Duganella]RFP19078.1 trimeric intracellular cation channel family protein [Duganella sp. BJB475]RFP35740.1 trimeric intracellular cation channel family protein [Duganella sp. BJB476]
MLFYILDLIGVAVFAASGTLAAMASHLDLLGIMVLAAMTAIGGGTVRDLLLNRHPVFWIEDPKPLLVIVASAVFTIVWVQVLPVPTDALLIADALGLALFAMSGAKVAEAQGCRALIVILMGTLTGVGGGLVRDILAAKVPLILRQDIYATAAIAGILLYILLKKAGMPPRWAFGVGLVSIVVVRLLAIQLGLRLPSF